MKMKKKKLKSILFSQFVIGCLLIVALFVFSTSNSASAADWKPTGTVNMLVNCAVGCSADRDAREIQKVMQENKLVDVPVVVEALPGGGGSLCWTTLNKHAGDGHYFATNSPALVTNQLLKKNNIMYNDFSHLAVINVAYPMFVVRADSPIKTGQDLIDRLKADPSSVSIGFSSSRGNQNHVAAALVMKAAGGDPSKLKVVVFKGAADVMMNALGGHIDLCVGPASTYWPQVQAGKMRVLAIAAEKRMEDVGQDIPTWAELGYPATVPDFRGLMGPKGLSQEQKAYWDGVFSKLLKTPEWKKYDKENWCESFHLKSDKAEAYFDNLYNTYKTVLTNLGMI